MLAPCQDHLALGYLLLSSWFLEARGQQPVETVTALTGSQARLSVPNLPDEYQELSWLYGSKRKIVLHSPQGTTYFRVGLGERVCLDETKALHIWNLQKSDSGDYILQLLNTKGINEEMRLRLTVLDPVSTPVITVQDLRPQGAGCFLTLSCFVPTHPSVTITWSGPNVSQTKSQILKVPAHTMPASYTCKANDTLSSSQSTVTFAGCLTGQSPGELGLASWLLLLVPLALQALLT
ncbi:CD48 antigen [Sorex fumeus]|uniref:CD48 antigen n=1 Tax=Sorex fumeus TaxID=62283 RepID=UPI0024AE0304|nr:CD48 antigen [Sorex fumeus]